MARIHERECSASECSLLCNDYWSAGYGRIIMVPRVKLAYDFKVFDIIHPQRRNLTSIRGYTRLGGLPDNPRTDPQDRSWFGPHDRLFVEEESEELKFQSGPEYGEPCPFFLLRSGTQLPHSMVLGLGRCWRPRRTRRRSNLGTYAECIHEGRRCSRQT